MESAFTSPAGAPRHGPASTPCEPARRHELGEAEPQDPDLVLSTDAETWIGLGRGEIDVPRALEEGRVRLEGDRADLERMLGLFAGAAQSEGPPEG